MNTGEWGILSEGDYGGEGGEEYEERMPSFYGGRSVRCWVPWDATVPMREHRRGTKKASFVRRQVRSVVSSAQGAGTYRRLRHKTAAVTARASCQGRGHLEVALWTHASISRSDLLHVCDQCFTRSTKKY